MALAPGTRLGAYEIVSLIGAGGMGEVYRARDSRLERQVAIKVLPEDLRANPEPTRPSRSIDAVFGCGTKVTFVKIPERNDRRSGVTATCRSWVKVGAASRLHAKGVSVTLRAARVSTFNGVWS
jgi:serine/threonine protein kinase